MRLIDADELKRAIEDRIDYVPSNDYDEEWNSAINTAIDEIDNAPTIEPTRPQGETNAEIFKQTFGIYATELWSMKEADFLKWLNSEVQNEIDN